MGKEIQMVMSHSTGCSGWNLEFMHSLGIWGGVNTSKAKYFAEEDRCNFLDFDFRNPNPEKHLELAKKYDFRLAMSQDIMADDSEEDIREKLRYTDKLRKQVDRVVIPVHKYHPLLDDYELAYPNSPSFSPRNDLEITEFKSEVTHILGGAPENQREMLEFFPNVKSVDGNQVFQMAAQYGKQWDVEKQRWRKPTISLSNEEIFRRSVLNWVEEITKRNKSVQKSLSDV